MKKCKSNASHLTDSNVSLPREGPESGLVASYDPPLSHVSVVGAQAASGVVLNGTVVVVGAFVNLLTINIK